MFLAFLHADGRQHRTHRLWSDGTNHGTLFHLEQHLCRILGAVDALQSPFSFNETRKLTFSGIMAFQSEVYWTTIIKISLFWRMFQRPTGFSYPLGRPLLIALGRMIFFWSTKWKDAVDCFGGKWLNKGLLLSACNNPAVLHHNRFWNFFLNIWIVSFYYCYVTSTQIYLLWSKIPRFKLGSNDPRLGMRISQWKTQ